MFVPGGGSSDSGQRPPGRGQRYVGHQLHSQRAIRKIDRFDLVFCGRQAIDGDTAQVGPQLAEKLGIAQVTYFEKLVDLTDQTIRVRRDVGNGWEMLEARLPLLLTVLDSANEPRPAAAKRVMRFKRARCPGEIGNQVAAAMPAASAAEKEAEQARRGEMLKAGGLLIEQWDLDDIKADLQVVRHERLADQGTPGAIHRTDQRGVHAGGAERKGRAADDT